VPLQIDVGFHDDEEGQRDVDEADEEPLVQQERLEHYRLRGHEQHDLLHAPPDLDVAQLRDEQRPLDRLHAVRGAPCDGR
jgi:hypothetical protein